MEHRASVVDIKHFLETYARNKNLSLLDIGCSDGQKVTQFLGQKEFRGLTYTGLDSVYWDNDKDLRPASSKRVNFVYGDACNLPFNDHQFDLVVLSHVFEHIPNSDKLCSEISRVLKKDGKLLVIVPLEKGGIVGFINRNRNLWKLLRIVLGRLRILPYNPVSPHVHFKSYEEYRDFFESKFNFLEGYARGSLGMLMISIAHENVMGFFHRKINLMELTKKYTPHFFSNAYRRNKHFRMDGVFFLSLKPDYKVPFNKDSMEQV